MSNYIHGAYGKPKGINTTQRIVGKSAYEIAVEHGFVGSEEEWLESLKGKSAYEVAVDLGYEGTADEWVESIGMAMGIDLVDELTDLKDDLNHNKKQVSVFNELINPTIYDSDDVVTGAAWTSSTMFKPLYMQKDHAYVFTITIPSALSTTGYFSVRRKDGTGVYTGGKIEIGATIYTKTIVPTTDIEEGYASIVFGTANVSVHGEVRGVSDKTVLDDLHDEKRAYTEATINLVGYATVGQYAISSSGTLYYAGDHNLCTKELIACTPSTAYAFRAFYSINVSLNYMIAWYDSTGAFISAESQNVNAGGGYTATSPATAYYMRYHVQRSSGIPDDTVLMIVTGSTVPSEYVRPLCAVDSTARNAAQTNADDIDSLETLIGNLSDDVTDIETQTGQRNVDISNIRYKRNIKKYEYPVVLEQGAFDSNGLNTPSNKRLRSRDYIPVEDGFWVLADIKYNNVNIDVLPIYYDANDYVTPQIGRRGQYNTTPFYFYFPKGTKYIRLYITNGGEVVVPENATITLTLINYETAFRYVYPMITEKCFSNLVALRKNVQDIAVYDGHIFDFGTGYVSVDGGENIAITNGHGNNANFGSVLHGDFPYLYCPSWDKNAGDIYVNQYANGAFTLVDTIHYELSGYLNACVDDTNERAYILLNTSDTTSEGAVDFIIGDLDGNVISRKTVQNIPYIAGMTFYDGYIYVSSGYRVKSGYPSYLTIFDTSGNVVSRTSSVDCCDNDAIEGIDIDQVTGKMYLAMIYAVLT